VPDTIARSIAIGNPADGSYASLALRESGGWAAAVSDEEIVAAIGRLARDVGVFTETAGGATLGAAIALAKQGRFNRKDEVVICITGNGLKTLDAVSNNVSNLPVINAKLGEARHLVASLS
jgi:threonine synthase